MKRTLGNLGIFTLLITGMAVASPLTVMTSAGNLSYSADFRNLGGGLLQITLSNTGVTSPSDESGVIGALFFSLVGDPVLHPVAVSLGSGSTVVNGSGDPSLNWQYVSGLNGPHGATQGLSAAGYGLFGPRGNFCSGANCGNLLQGIDWGIVNSAYVAGSGNGSISSRPMIRDTAVFVLSGIAADFDPSSAVETVSAQYSASLTGKNIVAPAPGGIPEPSTYVLMGTGFMLLSFIRRQRIDGAKE
jgi:hypothetical protein